MEKDLIPQLLSAQLFRAVQGSACGCSAPFSTYLSFKREQLCYLSAGVPPAPQAEDLCLTASLLPTRWFPASVTLAKITLLSPNQLNTRKQQKFCLYPGVSKGDSQKETTVSNFS